MIETYEELPQVTKNLFKLYVRQRKQGVAKPPISFALGRKLKTTDIANHPLVLEALSKGDATVPKNRSKTEYDRMLNERYEARRKEAASYSPGEVNGRRFTFDWMQIGIEEFKGYGGLYKTFSLRGKDHVKEDNLSLDAVFSKVLKADDVIATFEKFGKHKYMDYLVKFLLTQYLKEGVAHVALGMEKFLPVMWSNLFNVKPSLLKHSFNEEALEEVFSDNYSDVASASKEFREAAYNFVGHLLTYGYAYRETPSDWVPLGAMHWVRLVSLKDVMKELRSRGVGKAISTTIARNALTTFGVNLKPKGMHPVEVDSLTHYRYSLAARWLQALMERHWVAGNARTFWDFFLKTLLMLDVAVEHVTINREEPKNIKNRFRQRPKPRRRSFKPNLDE